MQNSILIDLKKIDLLVLVLVLLSTAMFGRFIVPVEADGTTIFIRADGSVEGTTHISSVDNITYTFTDNFYDEIVVERDNIVIDGADYTLQGTGSGVGLNLTARSNVTIKNMEIEAFSYGIWLENNSKNNSISANNITNNEVGISIKHSPNNTILGNNITNNDYGIFSYQSLNNSLSGNRITNNGYSIKFYECSKNSFSENEITSNRIGVMFDSSSNNNFSGNNVMNNINYGIYIIRASNNSFSGNNIISNSYGIRIVNSPNNNVSINNITSNQYGIVLLGPYIYSSGQNIVYGNNITNNNFGIQVISPSNVIYYNNFINNAKQVYTEEYSFFQLNYWSDYTSKDRNGDNIGDTPYGDYLDRYPLMKPWSPGWYPQPSVDQAVEEETPFWMQWWFWTMVAAGIIVLAGAVYFLKKRKSPTPTVSTLPTEGTPENTAQNTNH